MHRSFYIDMDGVLMKYDKEAYTGENPIWLQKNAHYFRDLPPDRKALEFIDRLWEKCRYTGDEVFILTTLPMNSAMFNEHFHDKMLPLNKWVSYIDIEHILISVTAKNEAVEYIRDHKLTQNDVLIDDYNKNLASWQNAGGTAVKYCNGINDPNSWNGPKITADDPVYLMFHKLGIQ